ncbi:hypothetical protein ACWEQL_36820 [Kitasatospora sp. NPDC004240]
MHDRTVAGLPAEAREQEETPLTRPAAIVIRRLEKKETTTASNSIGN